jgi:aminocarboxymuconate-semialdehyde decarboxylase
VPIFCHGYNQSVSWGEHAMDDRFDSTSIVGMCNDEARLFWFMINGGVIDRFPNLKVYITHGGGFVPYQVRRFHETNLTMAPDSVNKKPVLDYMPNFYFDLDIHSPAMRRAVATDIGADRLLYGTNFGGADSHEGDLTEDIGLSESDREKVRSGNAIKLLGL